MNKSIAALLIGVVALLASQGFSQDPKVEGQTDASRNSKSTQTPLDAVSALRSQHLSGVPVLIEQKELDGLIDDNGGGACATAAAINLVQVLRVMAGRPPLANPHAAALAAFADQRDLLKGKVTNQQFVHLVSFYEKYLDDYRVELDVESAPKSAYDEIKKTWPHVDGPNLQADADHICVLSFTVMDNTGKTLGRHFVLLAAIDGPDITVLDPQKPLSDRSYHLDPKRHDRNRKITRIFLRPPASVNTAGKVFELNTVFHVALRPGKVKQSLPASITIEAIKAQMNETASLLRGSEEFLSPVEWRKLTARSGLPALDLPVNYGGANWKATEMLEVFRHAGSLNLNFRDIVGAAHGRALLSSKSAQVIDIVRQVAKGDAYIAIAITEPTVGGDVSAIKSSSRKVNGGYLLTGIKRFNARLNQSSHVIIFTQGATGIEGELSAFVMPVDTPGLEFETIRAHGLTGNSYGGVKFKNVFVSDSQRLGDDGKGMSLFFNHFLYWRLMQTSAAIGTGEEAIRQMAERIKTRNAFGGPIGRFTHLQQPIGQYTTELKMAYALARDAAERLDRGDYGRETRALVCGLKAEGVEVALRAVDASARAFGGEGYSGMVDIGDRLRDLNGLRIADGTTDVMRMEVVRQTFGEEFWEMAIEKN